MLSSRSPPILTNSRPIPPTRGAQEASLSSHPVRSVPPARVAAGIALTIGVIALVGWATGSELLTAGWPGMPPIKVNAACGVILAGLSLWLSSSYPVRWQAGLADACAIASGALGAVTLAEYAWGWDLGIDQLLFADVPTAAAPFPGRMALNAAVALVLLAGALWRRARLSGRQLWVAEGCAVGVQVVSTSALLGYLFGSESFTGVGNYSHMAVPAAVGLLVLAAGTLVAAPHGPLARVILSSGPGGLGMRRLFPILVLGIVLLSWIRLMGQERGLYDTGFGLVVTTMVTIILLGGAMALHAGSLDRAEAERREVEATLQQSEERLRLATEGARVGTWTWDIARDELHWSRLSRDLFGIGEGAPATYAQFAALVHPEDLAPTRAAMERAWAERAEYRAEFRAVGPDKSVRWVLAIARTEHAPDGTPLHMAGVMLDIDQRRRAEEDLRRSNADLEQFAYVASHDLQEPLRMVASYVQLLAKRYRGKLDADADEFIGFALDGAMRMQRLIEDLLAYARVGTRGAPHVSTDPGEVLEQVLEALQVMIGETGATVTHTPMPRVLADPWELELVFLNLVANGIKFHRGEAPRVHVSAHRTPLGVQFSVRDNGIGIEPRYHDRIFVIFQRLHGRGEYPGTGIGLAIVKRIVERHGGRLWLESVPGSGSTFHFTLPLSDEP